MEPFAKQGSLKEVIGTAANLKQRTSTEFKVTTTTEQTTTSKKPSDGPRLLDSLRKPWVIVLAAVLQVTLIALVGSFLYRKFVKRLKKQKVNNNPAEKTPCTEESVAFKSSDKADEV